MFIAWIVFALVLGVIELFSMTFILLWIAISAFLTGLFGLFVHGIEWQVGFFVILSLLLLIATWRISARWRNRPSRFKSRVDELVGEQAQVLEGWSAGGSGLVKIRGEVWSAKGLSQDLVVQKDDYVRIAAVETTQVLVESVPLKGER